MAGGVDAIAANSSGSAAAIASGSTVPKRSSTLAGPRKACSIGYCWSSIMPDEQRERGVVENLVGGGVAGDLEAHGAILPDVRPPRAAAPPDVWRAGRDYWALTARTGQGASRSTRWALLPRMSLPTGERRRRPMTSSSAPLASAMLIRSSAGSKPRTSWRTSCSTPASSSRFWIAAHVVLGGPGSGSVELLATPVGVHHDQLAAAQLGLVDTGSEGGLALRLGDVSDDDGAHGVSSRGRDASPLACWHRNGNGWPWAACGGVGRTLGAEAVLTGGPTARAAAGAPGTRRPAHARRPAGGHPRAGRGRGPSPLPGDPPRGGAGRGVRATSRTRRCPTPACAPTSSSHSCARAASLTPRPALWLTRPGELSPHDDDLRWLGPAAWAAQALGMPVGLVVVTRRGWFDPVSDVRREWRRLRPRRRPALTAAGRRQSQVWTGSLLCMRSR